MLEKAVAEGRYPDMESAVRVGVALVEDSEAVHARLLNAVEKGLADVEAGHTYDIDEVLEDLEHLLKPRDYIAAE